MTAVVSDQEFSLDLGYSDLDSFTLCDSLSGDPESVNTLSCTAGVTGRYVYLYLPLGGVPWLALCEVEIHGTAPEAPEPGKRSTTMVIFNIKSKDKLIPLRGSNN